MLENIDYQTVVLVWVAEGITKLMLCLMGAVSAVDPAICRHVLHREVVKDVLGVCK